MHAGSDPRHSEDANQVTMPRRASAKRQRTYGAQRCTDQRPTGLERGFGCTAVNANKKERPTGLGFWCLGVGLWEGGGGRKSQRVGGVVRTTQTLLYLSFLLFGDVIPEFSFDK